GNTVNGKAVTTEAGKEISFQKSVESVEQKGNDEIVQVKHHSAAQSLQMDGKQEAKVSNAAPVLNESLIAKSKTENDEKKNSPEVQKISSQNESEKPVVKTLLSDKQSGADVHQHQPAQPEVKDDTAKTSPEVEETKPAEIQQNVSTNHQANETKNSLPKEKISSGNFQLPETEKTIKSFELSKEISKIIESGTSQKVVLRLLPEALGKVKLTLEVGGEIIHAKAEVENESVRQIIQTNTETLKQTLSQNGLQLASFNVSLAGSDEKQQKAHGQKKRSNSFTSKTKIEKSVLPEAARKLGYNTYEYLA
ncbi:MAG: flagellar hook-length control protein FliK, partial [Ignavibacteria bacterium]|nr:flagellar hook-length control protein FliK [Ignavibacteria bacterium]